MLGLSALAVIVDKRSLSFTRIVDLSILQSRSVLNTFSRNPSLLAYRTMSSKPHNLLVSILPKTSSKQLIDWQTPKIPNHVVPPGWTADPEKMADLSEKFDMLRRKKNYDTPISGIPRALLVDNKSGVPNVLVEVSDPNGQHDRQYYIWNQLTNFVSEVLAPKTAKEIAPLLLADGQAKEGLVVRRLKSGGAPMSIAKSDKPTLVAPLGWTADPEEMAYLDEAFEDLIRNEYDIPKSGIPRTLLASEGGVPDVLVELSAPNGQDDRQYYIWNQLSGHVSKVVAPTTAEKIVPLFTNGGERRGELQTRLLE